MYQFYSCVPYLANRTSHLHLSLDDSPRLSTDIPPHFNFFSAVGYSLVLVVFVVFVVVVVDVVVVVVFIVHAIN